VTAANVSPERGLPRRIGYLVPEFPGQTHVWIWREIEHVARWCDVTLFSTRPPGEDVRGRHAFAAAAADRTTYLWGPGAGPLRLAGAVLWALVTRPAALLGCIGLALTLPVDERPRWRTTLPLVAPACRLALRARRAGIEHLHCHTCGRGAIVAMLCRRLSGTPFSLTLNADLDWWGGAMAEKLADAEFTVAISERLLADVRRRLPDLPSARVVLGRIGVDTDAWTPPERDAGARESARIVGVGRLHPSKGFDVLLRAVAALRERGHEVQLRVAGEGPAGDELRRLAAALGLTDHVHWMGSLAEDDVRAQLSFADVFCLASHAEPLGVVYMEAMALGLPTVGTAAGGVAEIITDGVDGVLVPPGDVDALADALAELLSDSERRRRLGERARRTIVERFDSRIGAATLYERLTGEAPPTAGRASPAPPPPRPATASRSPGVVASRPGPSGTPPASDAPSPPR